MRSSPRGSGGGRGIGGGGGPPPASGKGGGSRARGAALLPFPDEGANFLEDHVQEDLIKPLVGTVKDVGSPGRGMDLPAVPAWLPTTRW